MLADEPTASLDSERGKQVVQAFRDLIKENNRAGVIVTHDLRMVQYTDRVIRMRDGKVSDMLSGAFEIEMLSGMSDRTMTTQPVPRHATSTALLDRSR